MALIDQPLRRDGEEKETMTPRPNKMSDIMKEMSERLLRNPAGVPSSEAAHVALMFANFAWNEAVGIVHPRKGYRSAWETIEAENPEMWSEFKSNDVDAMIDELIQFKEQHYPKDKRRILSCGTIDGKLRVEWLAAAAPGVDTKWEMRLYGLVRTGKREKAIEFLQQTRHMSRNDAATKVMAVAAELGVA
jgi:hypothetical protein